MASPFCSYQDIWRAAFQGLGWRLRRTHTSAPFPRDASGGTVTMASASLWDSGPKSDLVILWHANTVSQPLKQRRSAIFTFKASFTTWIYVAISLGKVAINGRARKYCTIMWLITEQVPLLRERGVFKLDINHYIAIYKCTKFIIWSETTCITCETYP